MARATASRSDSLAKPTVRTARLNFSLIIGIWPARQPHYPGRYGGRRYEGRTGAVMVAHESPSARSGALHEEAVHQHAGSPPSYRKPDTGGREKRTTVALGEFIRHCFGNYAQWRGVQSES
jgi:hypothetical protein